MRQKLLTVMFLLMTTLTISAQSTLNVHKKSGDIISYAFSEQLKVTYSGDNLILTTSNVEVQYPIADLSKFTFEDNPSGIISTTVKTTELSVTYVYNMAGTLLKTIPIGEALNTDDLNTGIYIIKNNQTTYKIIKK